MFSKSLRKSGRPTPLLPRPENWYMIRRVVAIYIYPIDKYGRPILDAKPGWWIVPRWMRDLYESFAEMGRKDGAIWGSYDYIASLQGVTAERARQQVQAMVRVGWAIKKHRTNEYGWYDTNLYGLVDPCAPRHALAIMIRTDDRANRYQIIKLSQQLTEVPEFPFAIYRQYQRERGAVVQSTKPASPIPLIIAPELYRKIAEAEGLTDPRWQSEAWRRFESARKKMGPKMKKPGAYWRGLVRHVCEEARDSQLPFSSLTHDDQTKERQRRRNWILGRAMKELLSGSDIARTAATIFASYELLAYCHETPCRLEEVMEHTQQAERALKEDHPSPLTAS